MYLQQGTNTVNCRHFKLQYHAINNTLIKLLIIVSFAKSSLGHHWCNTSQTSSIVLWFHYNSCHSNCSETSLLILDLECYSEKSVQIILTMFLGLLSTTYNQNVGKLYNLNIGLTSPWHTRVDPSFHYTHNIARAALCTTMLLWGK